MELVQPAGAGEKPSSPQESPIQQNTPSDIGYAAGIFDGEGSVAVYRGSGPNRRGIVYAVSVSQKDHRLLHWMKEHFGGGVYADYGKSRSVCGEWRATGLRGYEFLRIIRPLLQVKGESVDLMLRAWEVRQDPEAFDKVIEERKALRNK